MPDIKTQVDLLKITMKREGNAKNAGAEKEETHHADVGGGGELIQFKAWRHQRLKQEALDRVVEHHEVPPFGGEEDILHLAAGVGNVRAALAGSR